MFASLVSDVFPGIAHNTVDLETLLVEVRYVCNERSLDCTPEWTDKVIQLYQMQQLHHGVILVGQPGSGKSAVWSVLLAALERVERVEGVSYVIDPKALTKDELYGYMDATTREWTDGLFTHILRKILDNVRGEIQKRHFIVFDGDIDPLWVENLNR